MAGIQALDKQYSVKFFSTLVTNLQKLCQAYISYDKNIEVSGYLCIDIDNSKKERYVLSELLQNSGSVVSESYCTKVFRTVPPATPASVQTETTPAARQNTKDAVAAAINPTSYVTSDIRSKPVPDRRSSLPGHKANDVPIYPELSNGSSTIFGHDVIERHKMALAQQRSKQSTFDQQDKENAARIARDATHRLSEAPDNANLELSNSWHQSQKPTRLPSFAHISRRKSFSSASMFSPVEPLELDSIKVEGSKARPACAQDKTTSAPVRSLVPSAEGGSLIAPGAQANLSSLGQMMEAFAASRSPVGLGSYASADRFPTPSASVSTPQPGHSPSTQPHYQLPPTVWSPPDTPPGKGRVQSAVTRNQQDVFMQMLPQGYGDSTSKHGVQVVHADVAEAKAAPVGSFGGRTSEDTLDVDMEDMGGGANPAMADVNPSLSLSGVDQNMLSEYMMSSAQVTDIQRKRNAQLNCQRYALRLFCEFHQNLLGAMPSLDTLPSEQVDAMLGQFYATSKKGNGEDFTVSSLRSIQYYLESHLFENYIHSGSRAAVFRNSRQALRTRCEELRLKQKTTPVSKRQFTAGDVDALFEKGQLGSDSPDVLLNSLWFMNVTCFGIKGSEHFTLRWGDIILNTDKEGNQFLEYSGAGNSGQADGCLRVYALPHHAHRCCVHLFKQYLGHRPAIALQPDDPFYLNVNTQYKRLGTWFIKEKVSMSRLTSTWRSMLFGAGLPPDKKPPIGFQKGLFIQDVQSPVLVARHVEYPLEVADDS